MVEPETKEFHIGDILSVTTGFMLSSSGIDGVYKLVEFLTGTKYVTSIGRLMFQGHARDELLKQFPQFKKIWLPLTLPNDGRDFVMRMELEFGSFHLVSFDPDAFRKFFENHVPRFDVEAIRKTNPNARIVAVKTDE